MGSQEEKANSRPGEVVLLSNAQKPTQRVKDNEDTEKYVLKEKDKTPQTGLNKTEKSDWHEKEFKI